MKRNMKIGAMYESFKLPLGEVLKIAKENGIDGLQFYGDGALIKPDLTDCEIREIKTKLDDAGVEVSAVCGDFGCEMYYTGDEKLIDKEKRITDVALRLGTKIVTTHIGAVSDDENCPQYRSMLKVCKTLAAFADESGARFAVETGPEKADTLRRFLDETGSRGVSVNLDPANLVMCAGDDPARAVNVLKDYIVHTHAKDGLRLRAVDTRRLYAPSFYGLEPETWDCIREVPLGEGGVKWDEYLAALVGIGYDGFLTVEREVGDKPQEDILKAVTFLKEKLKAIKEN